MAEENQNFLQTIITTRTEAYSFRHRKGNPVLLSPDTTFSMVSFIWNSHSGVWRVCITLLQDLLMLLTVYLVVTVRFSVTEQKGKAGSLNLVFCCLGNHFRNLLCRSLKGIGLRLPGCFVSELTPKSQKFSSNSESHFI